MPRAWFLSVALAATAALQLVAATTPPGFEPDVPRILQVGWKSARANPPGKHMKSGLVAKAPALIRVDDVPPSTSFVVILLDITVPSATSPTTNTTFLHFLHTNLAPQDASGFPLESKTPPLVPYFAPAPLRDQTHTYVALLFAQPPAWAVPPAWAPVLRNASTALQARAGFDLAAFAADAGLAPVAATYFFLSTYATPASKTAAEEGGAVVGPTTAAEVAGGTPTAVPAPTSSNAAGRGAGGGGLGCCEWAFVVMGVWVLGGL